MFRTKHIIPRTEIFNWIKNPEIVKIVIEYSQNRSLRDPEVVKIQAYHRIEWNEFCNFLGHLKRLVDDNIITEHSFATGMQASKAHGFITTGNVRTVFKLQKKYPKVNFCLPKKIIQIFEDYEKEKN